MSLRERLERKLERRREWADKAGARATSRFNAAARVADAIPLGQPILVGHHSERHARRDAERIRANMSRGCEELDLAKHHASAAGGLAAQLDASVFSDDDDAIMKLEARIAEREAEADRYKAANAAIRKHAKAGADAQVAALVTLGYSDGVARKLLVPDWCGRVGFPSYAATNLRANIRRDRARIDQIKAAAARAERVEAAGGVLLVESDASEYASVQFSEKPEREIIDALKAAGWWWADGRWQGKRAALPDCVRELAADDKCAKCECGGAGCHDCSQPTETP